MKKYLFALSALLLTATFGLVACGEDDDQNELASKLAAITLKSPSHSVDAKLIKFIGTKVGDKIIESIELTESGKYLVTYREENAATRGLSDLLYLFGTYTGSGTSFQLSGFGNISISGDNVNANVTLTVGSVEVTVPVTISMAEAESLMATYLCRTWTVTNTRLRYPTSSGAVLAKDFPGECNLKTLVDFAREYVDIKDSFNPDKIVKGVTFTTIKSFLINYADDTYDVGSWSWDGTPSVELQTASMTYHWNSDDMGASFMNGKAGLEFAGNTCKLSLKADISGKQIEVVWTMQSM
ncbi:MAG: hypothetical protein IJT98_05750 [Prevotella sp.]|nr:hypothetical protein [Prevotella sp.]